MGVSKKDFQELIQQYYTESEIYYATLCDNRDNDNK
jgi:hypothetical protein